MTNLTEFTFLSSDGKTQLHAMQWLPEGTPRAVLQISHGVAEHIGRYDGFARYLNEQGIAVVGHDHLGHGGSIRTRADYGYFAQPDGNRAVLDDLHAVTALTKQLYPGVPYFLLGHSMGSFYARQYLCEWGDELDGAIIMGTGFQPKALVATARALCRVLAVFFGWEHRSKLVANLSFLGYNRGLEGRTPQDWLNRDQAEVDKYRADERCMFTFTLNAYYSMFTGILRLYDPAVLAGMPKDLPLLFLAGDADPVGERTAGVRRAIQSLRNAGVGNMEEFQLFLEAHGDDKGLIAVAQVHAAPGGSFLDVVFLDPAVIAGGDRVISRCVLGSVHHFVFLRFLYQPLSLAIARQLPYRGEPLAKRESFTECQGLSSIGATTTTAASGGNRESLLGPRPARRKQSAADAGCRNPGSGTP